MRFEVFGVFCSILISVFTKVCLAIFQLPRRIKEVFHGYLTRKEIRMLIFSIVAFQRCYLYNYKSVNRKIYVMYFVHRTTSCTITIKKCHHCQFLALFKKIFKWLVMSCFFMWRFPVTKRLSALLWANYIIIESFQLWETCQIWKVNIKTVLKTTRMLSEIHKFLFSLPRD